jgi:imidazolonepropionase-like amidohydrolase
MHMTLVLANALVIHGDPAVSPRLADVRIEGERIADVGAPGSFGASATNQAADRRIDLAGRALLPGLIDLHVHLCLTGEPRSDELFESESPDRMLLRMAGLAQQHLHAGVTTIRDLGGPEPASFVLRDAIADGLLAGPRILAAGLVITTTNGHGNWLGAPADDAAAVARAVQGRIDAGADAIKIIATGGVHTQGSDLMAAQYTEDEMRAGIETAHRGGLTVGSHASNPVGMVNAIRAGVDSIEHGIFLDDATAALMAEHDTTFVPTLAATHLYEPHANHPTIPQYVREKAALTVPAHRNNFPFAVRHGVRLAVGTDAGSTFVGHGLAAVEVEILTRFGLSALEAIAAGTVNAARMLHLEGEIGTVAEGRLADLLIVDGDPTRDIAALQAVAMVLKSGRIVRELLVQAPPA